MNNHPLIYLSVKWVSSFYRFSSDRATLKCFSFSQMHLHCFDTVIQEIRLFQGPQQTSPFRVSKNERYVAQKLFVGEYFSQNKDVSSSSLPGMLICSDTGEWKWNVSVQNITVFLLILPLSSQTVSIKYKIKLLYGLTTHFNVSKFSVLYAF